MTKVTDSPHVAAVSSEFSEGAGAPEITDEMIEAGATEISRRGYGDGASVTDREALAEAVFQAMWSASA